MGIFLFGKAANRPVDSEDHVGVWYIRESLDLGDLTALYALAPLEFDNYASYSIRFEIHNDFESDHTIISGPVEDDHEAGWAIGISADHEAPYRIIDSVEVDLEAPYLLSITVEAGLASSYDIKEEYEVEADFKGIWVIVSFISEQIDNSVAGVVASEDVEFFRVQLTGDDDSYCITLNADMASVEDWSKCLPGLPIDITVNGTEFKMLIDSRKRQRAFQGSSYAIEGRSITALLGKGNASPITKTWPSQTAKEVVEELCLPDGISTLFELTDWIIPANTLVAESIFPIQIIDQIAKAAGGIVQTKPDGTLVIRPKYPIPPPEYEAATPELGISDVDDIYSIDESKVVKPKYNAVRVMDEPDASGGDFGIREVDYDPTTRTYTLAVTSTPYDPAMALKFKHSNAVDHVTVDYNGITQKEITETVEIVNGKGNTEWIVDSVVSYDYTINTDLGVITPGTGAEIVCNVAGQSIVDVTYQTSYHEFTVSDDYDEKVQVYVED